MKRPPSFLVQALDNAGSNLVEVTEDYLLCQAEDVGEERALRESIASVARHASDRSVAAGEARLRVTGGRYNLEIDLPKQDAAGRTVVVLCHGQRPYAGDLAWRRDFQIALERFLEAERLPTPRDLDRILAEAQRALDRDGSVQQRTSDILSGVWRFVR